MAKKPAILCVACGVALNPAGKTWRCACGGAWVTEAWLVDMAEQQKGRFAKLPWEDRAGSPRACPECATPMQTVALAGIELDRCAAHGIWFDAQELPAALAKAKAFPVAKPDEPRPVPVFAPHVPQPTERSNYLRPDYSSPDSEQPLLGVLARIFEV